MADFIEDNNLNEVIRALLQLYVEVLIVLCLQIEELREDIRTPEYCCVSRDYVNSSEPDVNSWFGPKGTVSPLHFDPKDNILAQVSNEIFNLIFLMMVHLTSRFLEQNRSCCLPLRIHRTCTPMTKHFYAILLKSIL